MGCQQSKTATMVNTTSLDKIAQQSTPPTEGKLVLPGPAPWASDKISNRVALGAGCFWGTQKYIVKGTSFPFFPAWLCSGSLLWRRRALMSAVSLKNLFFRRLSEKVPPFHQTKFCRLYESSQSTKDKESYL